jgi:hypothetical protein
MAAVYPAGPLPTMMTSRTDSLLIVPFVNRWLGPKPYPPNGPGLPCIPNRSPVLALV